MISNHNEPPANAAIKRKDSVVCNLRPELFLPMPFQLDSVLLLVWIDSLKGKKGIHALHATRLSNTVLRTVKAMPI